MRGRPRRRARGSRPRRRSARPGRDGGRSRTSPTPSWPARPRRARAGVGKVPELQLALAEKDDSVHGVRVSSLRCGGRGAARRPSGGARTLAWTAMPATASPMKSHGPHAGRNRAGAASAARRRRAPRAGSGPGPQPEGEGGDDDPRHEHPGPEPRSVEPERAPAAARPPWTPAANPASPTASHWKTDRQHRADDPEDERGHHDEPLRAVGERGRRHVEAHGEAGRADEEPEQPPARRGGRASPTTRVTHHLAISASVLRRRAARHAVPGAAGQGTTRVPARPSSAARMRRERGDDRLAAARLDEVDRRLDLRADRGRRELARLQERAGLREREALDPDGARACGAPTSTWSTPVRKTRRSAASAVARRPAVASAWRTASTPR